MDHVQILMMRPCCSPDKKIVCSSNSSNVDGTKTLTEDESTADKFDEFKFPGSIIAVPASNQDFQISKKITYFHKESIAYP